jgi:hypothetical protein
VQDVLIPQLWDEPARTGRVVELQLLDAALKRSAPHLVERLSCIDTGCFATGWIDTLFAGATSNQLIAKKNVHGGHFLLNETT